MRIIDARSLSNKVMELNRLEEKLDKFSRLNIFTVILREGIAKNQPEHEIPNEENELKNKIKETIEGFYVARINEIKEEIIELLQSIFDESVIPFW